MLLDTNYTSRGTFEFGGRFQSWNQQSRVTFRRSISSPSLSFSAAHQGRFSHSHIHLRCSSKISRLNKERFCIASLSQRSSHRQYQAKGRDERRPLRVLRVAVYASYSSNGSGGWVDTSRVKEEIVSAQSGADLRRHDVGQGRSTHKDNGSEAGIHIYTVTIITLFKVKRSTRKRKRTLMSDDTLDPRCRPGQAVRTM